MSFKSVISSFVLTIFLMRRVLANTAVTQSDINGLNISLQHSDEVANYDVIIFFAVLAVGMSIITYLGIYMCKNGYCGQVERTDSSAVLHPPPTRLQLAPPPITNNYYVPSAPPPTAYNPQDDKPPSYSAVVLNDLLSTNNSQHLNIQ